MKFNSLKHAIYLLVIIVATSCAQLNGNDNIKCDERPTHYEYIQEWEKDLIPYSGFDTLTFVRTLTNDTHTFIGQGKLEGFSNSSYFDGDCDIPSKLEYLQFRFVSNTFNIPIIFYVFAKKPNDGYKISISTNSFTYTVGVSVLGKPYSYQSRIIGNKSFVNVDLFTNFNHPLDTAHYVCFNETEGILQFKFPNGEYWNLIDN